MTFRVCRLQYVRLNLLNSIMKLVTTCELCLINLLTPLPVVRFTSDQVDRQGYLTTHLIDHCALTPFLNFWSQHTTLCVLVDEVVTGKLPHPKSTTFLHCCSRDRWTGVIVSFKRTIFTFNCRSVLFHYRIIFKAILCFA